MNYEPGRVILIHGIIAVSYAAPITLSDTDPNTHYPVSVPLKIRVLHGVTEVQLTTSLQDSPNLIIPSPFKFEQEFVLAIICQTYGYELLVNGTHFASFEHQIPFKEKMRIAVRHNEAHKIEYY